MASSTSGGTSSLQRSPEGRDGSPQLTLREFASHLWRLADLVRADSSRSSFRSKAYRRAVWSLDQISSLFASEDELLGTPGIGPGVASLVAEFRETGELSLLRKLEENYPAHAHLLARLPRMGPRVLRDLKADLQVETTDDLTAAIESGATDAIRGIGERTADLWRRTLELRPSASAIPAHQAWVEASQLAGHVAEYTDSLVMVAGAVRRVEEWVDQLDLVVRTDASRSVLDFLDSSAALAKTTEHKADGAVVGVSHSGTRVVLQLAEPPSAGTALFIATGPPGHVDALAPVPAAASEEDIYRGARLPWIPPAARGLDSLDVASSVIRDSDLRGDLHVHTDASPDGRLDLSTVAEMAIERGYQYLLVTDHTIGLRFGGLSGEGLIAQRRAIDSVRQRFPELTVLHGAELNIESDGSLDVEDSYLDDLDMAVAGVHSHFSLSRSAQTTRLLEAMSHPKVRVIAHLSGRRIGIRPPIDVDIDAVIAGALRNRVALEVNGHRDRLDMSADWVRIAVTEGTHFAANSDAHRPGELGNVANAVATLQRAGVQRGSVINTWPAERLLNWAAT